MRRLHGLAHGVFQRAAIHIFLDEVGDDLGVGLGDEFVPFLLEFVLQLDVILDDSVVHDHDLARAIAVRVGVFLGGAAVRGPAGMADAIEAIDRTIGGWTPRDWEACRRRGGFPFCRLR